MSFFSWPKDVKQAFPSHPLAFEKVVCDAPGGSARLDEGNDLATCGSSRGQQSTPQVSQVHNPYARC